MKNEISEKLDKIIEQNNYIIQMLERIYDDKQGIADLQMKFEKSQKTIRELNNEMWFKEHGYE